MFMFMYMRGQIIRPLYAAGNRDVALGAVVGADEHAIRELRCRVGGGDSAQPSELSGVADCVVRLRGLVYPHGDILSHIRVFFRPEQ